jgi:hypothetical protein
MWPISRSILNRRRKYILLWVKKTKICPQSPKTEFGAQNQYGRVMYPSIGNFTWSKKKYNFGGRKGEHKTIYLKTGIWASKSVRSCQYVYILLGVENAKIGPQNTKTEFRTQNQYVHVMYPTIRNFTWSKKKYTFWVKRRK